MSHSPCPGGQGALRYAPHGHQTGRQSYCQQTVEGGREGGREGERADLTNHIAEGRLLCRCNAAGHYLKFQWNFTDIGGW